MVPSRPAAGGRCLQPPGSAAPVRVGAFPTGRVRALGGGGGSQSSLRVRDELHALMHMGTRARTHMHTAAPCAPSEARVNERPPSLRGRALSSSPGSETARGGLADFLFLKLLLCSWMLLEGVSLPA